LEKEARDLYMTLVVTLARSADDRDVVVRNAQIADRSVVSLRLPDQPTIGTA
jgi:hypothetical protein